MNQPRSAFRLNVGFIIHLSVGSSRDFIFELPQVHLQPDLDLKDLSGSARVTRTPQGLWVQVHMHAVRLTECVRCLNEFDQMLDIDFAELYAFSARKAGESGLILPENGMIDLEPLVREYMWLAMPINPLCTIDCKGLCPICGESLTESPHHHGSDEIDPRLAILKSLLKKE